MTDHATGCSIFVRPRLNFVTRGQPPISEQVAVCNYHRGSRQMPCSSLSEPNGITQEGIRVRVKKENRQSGSSSARKRTASAASRPAARARSKTSTSAWGPALAGFTRATRSAARRSRAVWRQWPLEPRTVVYGSVGIIATAALIAALQSPGEARIARADDASEVARVESVRTPASAPRPSARSLAEPVAGSPRLAAAESESTTAATPVSTNGEQDEWEAATITGCLEVNDDGTFWLRDTSGADAPKTRSWKSGFLKKRSSSIELVDGVTTRRLAPHIGQRVETTGLLLDREMRVKSLRILGSCE